MGRRKRNPPIYRIDHEKLAPVIREVVRDEVFKRGKIVMCTEQDGVFIPLDARKEAKIWLEVGNNTAQALIAEAEESDDY